MASRPHLQAIAIDTSQSHGPHDHGDGWQSQLHPYHRNGKRIRLRHLKKGVSQGSTLAPLLFNIYISDLPTSVSRKYIYAEDLAIMHAGGDRKVVEGVLSKDMATVDEYLQTWKLKLSTTKMVSAVFHLNNKEPKREMKVNQNNETLPFCSEPKYLGVTLDRSLTYRRHLESLRKKLTSRVTLLRRLACSGWGAGATTLRTATLDLVHSTAEYCVPVWCHSAHIRLIDPAINNALRIVTGCLRPTPADNLPVVACRHPNCWASSQRSHIVSSTSCHGAWTSAPLSAHLSTECDCMASQIMIALAAQLICSTDNNIHAALWVDRQWNAEWLDNATRLRTCIPDTGTHPSGMTFRSSLRKWDMAWSAVCECGAEEQTVGHVVLQCPIHRPPRECMAWRFWTMTQSNGCSTPAPRSRAA